MKQPTLAGIRATIGIPGFGIFANMTGFAAIAREAGFDISMTTATSLLIWGAPGQVAMASLHMAEASLAVVFTGVALANLRFFMMTASTLDMLGMGRERGFWRKLGYAQITAITAWAQLGMMESRFDKKDLRAYFIAFAGGIYCIGMTGTVFGYYLSDIANEAVLRAVLVITPVYLLLMILGASRMRNRIAGIAGGIACPLFYSAFGEWAILIGGVVAGTAVTIAARAAAARRGGAGKNRKGARNG